MEVKRIQPIKVYARQRPFTQAETAQKCTNVVNTLYPRELILKNGYIERRYLFDGVYGGNTSQRDFYNGVICPLVTNVVSGYNCTVLTYGQTGTGKTHTVFGETNEDGEINLTEESAMGVIPRVADQLFADLSKLSTRAEYTVGISFVEIYNEEIRDLLAEATPLRIYDDPLNKGSICIKDLSKLTVMNSHNVINLLKSGLNLRRNGGTPLNRQSSRSHAFFTFTVDVKEPNAKGEEIIRSGKLQLIDLAGSENIECAEGTGIRAREADIINRSLITLGKVIKCLAQKVQHVPFRDSKLTRILQDSLGGKTKTAMIVTFSPSIQTWDETCSALDMGYSARCIQNFPQININKKPANLLKELNDEISKLKEELYATHRGEGHFISNEHFQSITQDTKANEERISTLLEKINELEEHYCSLELEFIRINSAFTKNTVYLENVRKTLQETQQIQEQERMTLQDVTQKHAEMYNTANVLNDVYENSFQRQDVFHRKYQERCATTLTNAGLAENMYVTANDCFQNVAAASAEYMQHCTHQMGKLRQLRGGLYAQKVAEASRVQQLGSDVHAHALEYKDKACEVANRNTSCYEAADNVLRRFNSEGEFQMNRQLRRQSLLEKFKRDLEVKNAEFSRNGRLVEEIYDNIGKQENFLTNRRENTMYVKNILAAKEADLTRQLENEEHFILNTKLALEDSRKQEEKLQKELETWDAAIAQVRNVQPGDAKQVEDSMALYINMVNAHLYNQKTVIDGVIQQINEDKMDVCNQAAANLDAVQNQVGAMSLVAQETLDYRNQELQRCLPGIQASFDSYNKMSEQRMQDFTSFFNVVDSMAHSQQQQSSRVRDYVDTGMSALSDLNSKINFVGHVGDTPAKGVYSYPRMIKGKSQLLTAPKFPNSDDESNKEN